MHSTSHNWHLTRPLRAFALVLFVVCVYTFTFTKASFSDEETQPVLFVNGFIDLAINDENPLVSPLINITNATPGNTGSSVIKLENRGNVKGYFSIDSAFVKGLGGDENRPGNTPGGPCTNITPDAYNGYPEPESAEEDPCIGNLQDFLIIDRFYVDRNNDAVYTPLTDVEVSDTLTGQLITNLNGSYPINEPIDPGQIKYLRFDWHIESGIPNPNKVMGDTVTLSFSFALTSEQ